MCGFADIPDSSKMAASSIEAITMMLENEEVKAIAIHHDVWKDACVVWCSVYCRPYLVSGPIMGPRQKFQ